jgi:YD repeat-containing protein
VRRQTYGTITYSYDAVGNRERQTLMAGGTPTDDVYTYDVASNRLLRIDRAGSSRSFSYTPDGNTETDSRGSGFGFVYNDAGRLAAVTAGPATMARYTYNAFGERVIKDRGPPASPIITMTAPATCWQRPMPPVR